MSEKGSKVGRVSCLSDLKALVEAGWHPANYKRLSSQFYEWSEDLGYVVGVAFGDGSPRASNHGFRLDVTDVEFRDKFARAFSKLGWEPKCYFIKDVRYRGGGKYRARINSMALVRYFRYFPLRSILDSPLAAKRGFLKGIFDSEGCVVCKLAKGEMSRYVALSNQSIELLEICQVLLRGFGIGSHLVLSNHKGTVNRAGNREFNLAKDTFRLQIYGRRSLTRFAENIGFSIPRKALVLRRLVESYCSPEEIGFKNSLPNSLRGSWRDLFNFSSAARAIQLQGEGR